jgi:Ca2+/H+ antiporter, TMEM165/GDT1 family
MTHFYGRRAIFFPLIGIAALVLFPYVIMLLWNALLPVLFHIAEINFWQALGILILSRILFGGFKGAFRHRYGNCYGHHNHMGPWRQRWMNMSEEERAKMKEEWQKRCGHHDQTESTQA